MKFRNFILGPVTEEREFNGKSFCVTGYSRAWRKKRLEEMIREENDRIKEESFKEIHGKTYKRKALSVEPKKMRLKPEYQQYVDDFVKNFANGVESAPLKLTDFGFRTDSCGYPLLDPEGRIIISPRSYDQIP